jgi:hypothetical protein
MRCHLRGAMKADVARSDRHLDLSVQDGGCYLEVPFAELGVQIDVR